MKQVEEKVSWKEIAYVITGFERVYVRAISCT